MIDYNKISIYDFAPVKDLVSPDEEPKREVENSYDAVNAQVRYTHRNYTTRDIRPNKTYRRYTKQTELYFDDPSMNHKSEGWQIIPDDHQVRTNTDGIVQEKNYSMIAPSDEGGPMQGEIRDWIEERIKLHTGSNDILHLRSWWSILTNDVAVPVHSHTYQTKRRTISGIMWTKGDICPLYVQNPGDEIPDKINNVPGRLVIFGINTNHWTDPYPHGNVRAGISFDYMINDQDCCSCQGEQFCYRCVHLVKNLKKVGIQNIYSGGSTTVKYEMQDNQIQEAKGPGQSQLKNIPEYK